MLDDREDGDQHGHWSLFSFRFPQWVSLRSGFVVAAFSGVIASSPFDVENGTGSSSASSLQPGSIMPSQNNKLVIAAVASGNNGSPFSINGGFTKNEDEPGAGNTFDVAMAYLIQTSAAAANPTWTASATVDIAAAIASFKSA
jgi:hypothetical protein